MAKNVFCEITLTLTSDLGPLKSNQFMPDSLWIFELHLIKFSQCLFEISCLPKKDAMRSQWPIPLTTILECN